MEEEVLEVLLKRWESGVRIARITQVDTLPATAEGDNFNSQVDRMSVDVVLGSGRPVRRSIILKWISEEVPAADFRMDFFRNEILMFEKVLRSMEELKEEFEEDTELMWPIYYGHVNSRKLLLQDLGKLGYRNADRRFGLTMPEIRLSLRSLARFHASSRILLDRHLIDSSMLRPHVFSKDPLILELFFVKSLRLLGQVMKEEWGPEWEEYAEKMDLPKDVIVEKMLDAAKVEESRFNVVCHGDLWCNNVMFRYNEDGYPIGLKFIDFQISFYNSPVWDLIYFLYTSLNSQTRRDNMEEMVHLYVDTLTETLRRFGYTGDIPDYEQIQEEFNRMRFWSFVSLVYFHAILTTEVKNPLNLEAVIANATSGGDSEKEGGTGFNVDVYRGDWQLAVGADLREMADQGIFEDPEFGFGERVHN